MGPLQRLASFIAAANSECDLNNNNTNKSAEMGFKGKKCKFGSEMDVFRENERIKTKAYLWASMRLTSKKGRGRWEAGDAEGRTPLISLFSNANIKYDD